MKLTKLTCLISLVVLIFSCSQSDDSAPPLELAAPQTISVVDISNEGNGSDVQVTFNKVGNQASILEYRVFVVHSNSSSSFSLEIAESLSNDRYTAVSKSEDAELVVRLSTEAQDTDGQSITQGFYTLFVMTVGIEGAQSALSEGVNFQLAVTDLVETLVELPIFSGDIITDSQGNIFASDFGSTGDDQANVVYKVTASGQFEEFSAGFSGAGGLCFDSDGNLYVSSRLSGEIHRVNSNGDKTLFVDGLLSPRGIDINSKGDLYVLNDLGEEQFDLIKVSPSGEKEVVLTSAELELLETPQDIAFDSDDNLYVTNLWRTEGGAPIGQSGRIIKITEAGEVSIFAELAAEPTYLEFVTFNDNNWFIVSDQLRHQVYLVSDQGGAGIVVAGSGFGDENGAALGKTLTSPQGITFDSMSNLIYVTSWADFPNQSPINIKRIVLDKTIK